MKNYNIVFLILTSFFAACKEDFEFNVLSDEKLAVEGWITNQPGPYKIKLTKSTKNTNANSESVEVIRDALVIIKDNAGNIDTLKYHETITDTTYDNSIYERDEQKYYTSYIQGIVGRTYYLYVKIQDKEYTAQSYMPNVPLIDSLSYVTRDGEVGKEHLTIPLIYFSDPPNERNYYLFKLYGQNNILYNENNNGTNRIWQNSVISDEYFKSYVNGYSVDDGASVAKYYDYYDFPQGSTIQVRMQSLTSEAYNFYKALLAQFENDGGVFSPSPATPPGNISNGALGFFGASAVTTASKKVK